MGESLCEKVYNLFLSSLNSINNVSSFYWKCHPLELCCWQLYKYLDMPLTLQSHYRLFQYPLVLEIMGQLFLQDCHLILQTYLEMSNPEETEMMQLVTCWIEPQRGMAVRTQWWHYHEAFYRLASTVRDPSIDMDRVLQIGHNELIQIQVICEVNNDEVSYSFFFYKLFKMSQGRNAQSHSEIAVAIQSKSTPIIIFSSIPLCKWCSCFIFILIKKLTSVINFLLYAW